jgi:hypothetical protein
MRTHSLARRCAAGSDDGTWPHCAPAQTEPKSITFLQVLPVPPAYLYAHHQLLQEFRNASHWPKHLLIQYSFRLAPSEDALSGLYVTFVLCAPQCPLLHMQICHCLRNRVFFCNFFKRVDARAQ